MQTTTPKKVSGPVRAILNQFDCTELMHISVEPPKESVNAEAGENVRAYCNQYGGEAVRGRYIVEWPGVLVEAIPHVVWRNPQGELKCLTGNQFGLRSITFFETQETFASEFTVDSIRYPIRKDALVDDLISLRETFFLVSSRYPRIVGRSYEMPHGVANCFHQLTEKLTSSIMAGKRSSSICCHGPEVYDVCCRPVVRENLNRLKAFHESAQKCA